MRRLSRVVVSILRCGDGGDGDDVVTVATCMESVARDVQVSSV